MTGPAPASVAPTAPASQASCSLCGTPDLLGVGTCASCSSGGRSDALLYLSREGSGESDRLSGWLADRLGLSRRDPGVRDAALGLRPIVRLSPRGAGAAVSALAAAGIPSEARALDASWRRVPGGLWGLAALVVATGNLAGLAAWPVMLAVTPAFAGLMLLGAVRLARTPVWQPGEGSTRTLPARSAATARRAVTDLPDSRGRHLLHDIVVNAGALFEMAVESVEAEEVAHTLNRLLPLACDAARDLTHLDESLAVLEAGPGDGRGVLERAREARCQLVERLEDTRGSLSRARALQAGSSLDQTRELAELANRLAEDAARHRDAAREVEELLAPA